MQRIQSLCASADEHTQYGDDLRNAITIFVSLAILILGSSPSAHAGYVQHGVKKGASATSKGVKKGWHATENGVEKGASATSGGVKKGWHATGRFFKKVF